VIVSWFDPTNGKKPDRRLAPIALRRMRDPVSSRHASADRRDTQSARNTIESPSRT